MSDNGKVLSALLLGAAAGAVMGLLFAPEKGSNMRKKIQGEAEDLMDELSEKVKEAKETLAGLKGKAKSAAEELKDKAMSKAEQMKAEAEEEMNSIKQKVKQTATSN